MSSTYPFFILEIIFEYFTNERRRKESRGKERKEKRGKEADAIELKKEIITMRIYSNAYRLNGKIK